MEYRPRCRYQADYPCSYVRFFVAIGSFRLSQDAIHPLLPLTPILKAFIVNETAIGNTVVCCYIHRKFVFGSGDMPRLPNHIRAIFGQHFQGQIFLRLNFEVSELLTVDIADTEPDLVLDLTTLPKTRLVLKNMDVDIQGVSIIRKVAWRAICRDSLRMIYQSLVQHRLNYNSRPSLSFDSITADNAVALANEVNPKPPPLPSRLGY